jgi:MFS family permease
LASLRELIPPAGPIRTLCVSHVSKTAANGVLMSILVLYFTRTVHVPADRVGLALTVGSAIGLLAAVPAGRLADAVGARSITIVLMCLLGIFASGYPLVTGFQGLVVVTALVAAGESAAEASVGALIARLLPPQERVSASSYMRAAANVSVVIGAGAAAVGLYLDRHSVYVGLLFGAAALFVVAGLAYLRVPNVAPIAHEPDAPMWPALRDAPFAVAASLNSVLIQHVGILTVALPIWISQRTNAPAWLYAVIVIVNAVSVVLLQVRVSRGSHDVPGGARAFRRAGLFLAACCALFALATGRPTWLTVALLLLGAILHVLGEMLQSSGEWALSFGLAPEHAQGQYQGLFAMSAQLGIMITPALATLLFTWMGSAGWLVFAGLFLVAGAASPAVGRWGLASRRPAPIPDTPMESGVA